MKKNTRIIFILCALLWSVRTGGALALINDSAKGSYTHALPGQSEWTRNIQSQIEGSEYEAAYTSKGLQAPNRKNNIRTYFSVDGVRVVRRVSAEEEELLRISLDGISRGPGSVESITDTPVIQHKGCRVEVLHSELTEWYVNSEQGLEHGFDIPFRQAGDGALRLNLKITSATAVLNKSNIQFITLSGQTLDYGKLTVTDALGHRLPSVFEVPDPQTVVLAIDDSKAMYPVRVDPVLSSPEWSVESSQVYAVMGYSVAGGGDVNKDGYADVIIGAPDYDNGETDEGRVFVYLGSSTGLNTTAAWTAEGNQISANFGMSVASAGDINKDGYGDIIIGAPYYDNGETNEGSVFVYYGSASGPALTPSWTAESNIASAAFGYSVSTAGDMNNDGYSDVLIGAPNYSNVESYEGKAYLYPGSATGPGTTPFWSRESNQAYAYYGIVVSTAGDFNGDGESEFLVSAPYYDNPEVNEGKVFYYHRYLSHGVYGIGEFYWPGAEGNQAGAYFGYSAAGAGDVNNDGYDDIIVGAPYYDNPESDEGRAYIYLGSASGPSDTAAWSGEGNQASAYYSYSVSGAGDVNGDGFDDIVIGAPYYDNSAADEGAAFIYLGSASATFTEQYNILFDKTGSFFGGSVAKAGDTNGDDLSDVVIGAPYYDKDATVVYEGKAFVYSVTRDIQVEELSFALSHNTGYFPSSETVTANFTLRTSVDRNIAAQPFDAKIEVVAYNPGSFPWGKPTEAGKFLIGTVRVSTSEIMRRDTFYWPGFEPKKLFAMTVSGNGFEAWVSSMFAARADRYLTMRVTADASNEVKEGTVGEINNARTESANTFLLLPLTGKLFFNSAPATLYSPSLDDAGCGSGIINITSGSINWKPSSNSYWNAQNGIPVSGLCASFSLSGTAFDLHVTSGSVSVPEVTGTMGGLNVSVYGNTLDSSGAHPGSMLVNLPEGHSIHSITSVNTPVAQGSDILTFVSSEITPSATGDYSNLRATNANKKFLHAPSLPFYLLVTEISVVQNNIAGTFSSLRYAYNLPFDPEDPRNPANKGVRTNDVHFSRPVAPSAANNIFSLNNYGLDIPSVTFSGAKGSSHFPRTDYSWKGFAVSINKSHASGVLTSGNTYNFAMSTDCPSCESGSADRIFDLVTDDKTGMADDGSVAGRLKTGLGTNPAWGPRSSSGWNIFERIDDSGFPGIVVLPGYEASGTNAGLNAAGDPVPVARYLLGMHKIDAAAAFYPAAHYSLTDNESRLGNYFMAGVNVGPEFYSQGAYNQPSAGISKSLTGTRTLTGFGGPASPDFISVTSNAGAKYVLRPGGLTGVFNTGTAPGPVVYGYRLDLRRFAYRLVNNKLDPYTWVDGKIALPGRAGFDVSFSSLELECSGHVSGGLVDRDLCGNGIDDNGNKIVDENCGTSLHAWKAPITLQTLSFEPESASAGVCDTGMNRLLRIGNEVVINSLDDPIGLAVQWNPDGDPVSGTIKLTSRTDHTVDRPETPEIPEENMGFDYAVSNVAMYYDTSSTERGWFIFKGELGVPFWEMLPIDARLENLDTNNRQRQSYLVRRDVPLDGTDDTALRNTMKTETSAAKYTWGGTGFSLNLPVYFETDRFTNKKPEFIGKSLEKDLVVLNIKGAADFITPVATKISFGASADIAEMKNLLPDLADIHVDLNDPDSIKRVDGYLNKMGFSGTPVGNTVNGIKDAMNPLNAMTGANFDGLVEKAVREGIDGAVSALPADPFAALSDSIGVVQGLPERAANVVSANLQQLTAGISLPLSSGLDNELSSIHDKLIDMIYQVETYNNSGTPLPPSLISALNDAYAVLDQASSALDKVNAAADGANGAVTTAQNEIDNIVNETTGYVNQVNAAINSLQGLLTKLRTTSEEINFISCDPAKNQILGTIKEIEGYIESAQSKLNTVDLTQLSGVASSIGVDMSSAASAQNDIRTISQDALRRVQEAENLMQSSLQCSGGSSALLSGVLDDASVYLNDIKTNVGMAVTAVNATRNALNGSGGLLEKVSTELDNAKGVVSSVKSQMDYLKQMADDARTGINIVNKYFGGTDLSAASLAAMINARITTATGGAYSWCYGTGCSSTFITEMSNKLTEPVYFAITQAATGVTAGLSGVTSLVPHPSSVEIKTYVVDQIMNNTAVGNIDKAVHDNLTMITGEMNDISGMAFDQVNRIVNDMAEAAGGLLGSALDASSGVIKDFPVTSAKMDGYAIIAGSELERAHVGAEWTMNGGADEDSTSYNAALDLTSWSANGKASNCIGGGSKASLLDAVISTNNMKLKLGETDVMLKKLYLGFTLENVSPVGLFGGVYTQGDINFKAFKIYDVGFACGVGKYENYLGATAAAVFSGTQMQAAFLVGKICNIDILKELDPQVGAFIIVPDGKFEGIYARGGASIPVFNFGCPLTIGAGVDAGIWFIAGSPPTLGGLVGGGIYGELGCIVSARGQITAMGQYALGEFSFYGNGFAAGGVGDCEPEEWTRVSKVRDDSWCLTCDVTFGAEFKNGWALKDKDMSCGD